MTPPTTTVAPTLARRRLARLLRRLRLEAGMTHADLTVAGIGSRSKLSAIEAGTVRVRTADLYAFTALYRLAPEQSEQLHVLAEAATAAGQPHPPGQARSAGLDLVEGEIEDDLLSCVDLLRVHAPATVPALVATEDYARAALGAHPTLTSVEVDQRVAALVRRHHALLRRPWPARVEVVVTAGALGRVVGSAQVMARQEEHLRSLDATENVSVRVLTAEAGLYTPICGAFSLLEFDDPLDPPLAFVPSLVDVRYFERADYLTAYRQTFATVSELSMSLHEYPTWSRAGPQPS